MATIENVLANEDATAFAIALSDLVFPRYDRDGFASLTPAEQVALCVDMLEREVNNGGFGQFFSNSSGEYVQETVRALEVIGAKNAAAMVREAAACGESAPEKLSELDGRFYEYPDDLTTLMRGYVTAHRAGFRPWP